MYTFLTKITRVLLAFLMALAALALAGSRASAAAVSIELCVLAGTVTMPDTAVIPIWGFGIPTTAGDCGTATASLPGPVLDVDEGDVITINLINALPGSHTLEFEIPGVSFDPGPTDGSAPITFTANAPGTYLYESAGDFGRQAAMGVYGALIVRPSTAGQAYNDPATAYDVEATLVLSQIDPLFNANPDTFDMYDYLATYWLINGQPYPATAPINAAVGDNVLLRYVNAGYDNTTMMLLGMHERVLARDASLLNNAFDANAETIASGATEDVIVTVPASAPPGPNGFPLYNRQLQTGMMTFIVPGGAPPVDTPPTVNAGTDQNITLPASAALDGTVTDDGFSALTTLWTMTSGPGTVTFGDDSLVDTTADFSVDGVYVLRLTATDGTGPVFDEVTITVDPEPVDAPPTVDAGLDQNITLPASAALDGTVTDDGFSALTTLWTMTSGPGTVTFGDDSLVDTTADFSVDGSYVLRLTATDGTGPVFDEVTITVDPAVAVTSIYFSTTGNTNPPGVGGTADDSDVYNWDGVAFSRTWDATGSGIPAALWNVDGLDVVDATHFYLSFSADLGLVQDEDIIYYDAGVFSVYFDGTAAGLTAADQDIDAFDIVGSTIYFSTSGNSNPPGVGGTADDADIYAWNGTSFSRVWDATGAGLAAAGVSVDGLVVVDATHFYLSFSDASTTVPTLGTVEDEDIVYFNGGVWSVYFDGTASGLTAADQDIDAFDLP